MSKIKNGGLDQYGAGPFEQQQFGTAGVEGVNRLYTVCDRFPIRPIKAQSERHDTANTC